MTAWSSCSGPWWSAASELAVALSTTPQLTELERLSARQRAAASRHRLPPTLPRAPHGVPGQIDVRAHIVAHGSVDLGGAALAIKTGADFVIGPTRSLTW